MMSQAHTTRAVINFDLNVTFMGCGKITRELNVSKNYLTTFLVMSLPKFQQTLRKQSKRFINTKELRTLYK